jgi:hypothetical protein
MENTLELFGWRGMTDVMSVLALSEDGACLKYSPSAKRGVHMPLNRRVPDQQANDHPFATAFILPATTHK